jgi:plastocyanin
MKRRRTLTTAATLAVPFVAGCTGSSGGGGDADGGDSSGGASGVSVEETSSVAMVNNQYEPRNIEVGTGTTVTWTNEDDSEHTASSASDDWQKDARVASGSETSHTFDESGVYDVFCSIHGSPDLSGMSMKIGVGDATIEAPLGGGDAGIAAVAVMAAAGMVVASKLPTTKLVGFPASRHRSDSIPESTLLSYLGRRGIRRPLRLPPEEAVIVVRRITT